MDPADLSAAALSQITGTHVLECLGKQPAPKTLASDLSCALALPPSVLEQLWTPIEPSLGAINTPHTAEVLASFCALHAIAPQAVAQVVGACRFLFLRGAERNAPPSTLEQDVRLLLAGAAAEPARVEEVVSAVVRTYGLAAPKLRLKAVYEALTDHGRVITDVKWRVDNVSHANTGESINLPVTLLTLRFREGDQTGQMTVQVLPDELRKLLAACEQALR